MLITLAQAIGGLTLLYFGGDSLVRGASALASRIGVSPLAIGLTVVAFGTSAPELVVSIDAALSGASDLSAGNVVGSNIANIALILGLAALLRPLTVQAKLVRVDAPLMLLVSLALVVVLADGRVSRSEGSVLLLSLGAYIVFTFWEARRESPEVRAEIASVAPEKTSESASMSLALVLVGIALLIGGGHLLVSASIEIATLLGMTQAVIGLTIVAVGTSLPELATSLEASRRGQGDIAIGNIVGSNIFNILGILGATAVIHPLDPGAITWVDTGTMVLAAGILTVLLSTRLRIERIEGSLLIAGYIAYTSWLLSA